MSGEALFQNLVLPIPLICSIKPRVRHPQDGFCWSHSNSGAYSVKSGYDLAMELKQGEENAPISEPSTKWLKAKVWKVKAPSKIKHFLWKSISNCLPVCDRLVERHCGHERSCPRCSADRETVNNLLFECPPAIQTWDLAHVPFIPGSFPSTSVLSNLNHILWRAKERNVPEAILFKAPWVMWYLWKARNEKFFNNKDVYPLDTLQLTSSEADICKLAQVSENSQGEDVPNAQAPPVVEEHTGKICKVDASWNKMSQFFGGGFHLKDEAGRETFGSFGSNQTVSPIQAEFRTLLWELNFVLLLGHHTMSFESDCLQLVNLLHEEQEDEEWPVLLAELEEFRFLRPRFTFISIKFISCALNSRADSLAKEA